MICFKTGNPRTTAAEAAVYVGGFLTTLVILAQTGEGLTTIPRGYHCCETEGESRNRHGCIRLSFEVISRQVLLRGDLASPQLTVGFLVVHKGIEPL